LGIIEVIGYLGSDIANQGPQVVSALESIPDTSVREIVRQVHLVPNHEKNASNKVNSEREGNGWTDIKPL
jgi:hypothetical protein